MRMLGDAHYALFHTFVMAFANLQLAESNIA
jgi:hypothetical protein